MAPSKDNLELLLLDNKFTCTASNVSTLSVEKLAIASFRKDLNVLIRQRAYSTFLQQEITYNRVKDHDRKREKLFEVDQDFPIEISKLNASELLLVQFQPEATLADVEEAASEFLDLSVEAKELEAKKRKSSNTSTSTIDSTDLGSLVSDMNVESFKLEKANGGGNSESGDLSMGIHSKGLLITQDGDEEIWKMDSEDITGVLYLAGVQAEIRGTTRQDCSLVVKGNRYTRLGKTHSTIITATIDVGPLLTDDPPFKLLRQTVRSWSKTSGFTIGAEKAPAPVTSQSPAPPSSRARRYSNDSAGSDVRDKKRSRRIQNEYTDDEDDDHNKSNRNTKRRNSIGSSRRSPDNNSHSHNNNSTRDRDQNSNRRDDRDNGRRNHGNDNDNRNKDINNNRNNDNNNRNNDNRRGAGAGRGNRNDTYTADRDREERERPNAELDAIPRPVREHSSTIWNYLGDTPMDITWNPGFYTRQTAFLTAIDIDADLKLPVFSSEDFAILSYKADPRRLPEIPIPSDGGPRVNNVNRVAAEKIFREKGFLPLESTKWIMSNECDMPDLTAYVEIVAKVVLCRDIFKTAWSHLVDVLERKSYNNDSIKDEEGRRGADDDENNDISNNVLDIVKKLANFEASRVEIFADPGGRVTRVSKLGVHQLGEGPHHRYTQALNIAIAFEDKALRTYDLIRAERLNRS